MFTPGKNNLKYIMISLFATAMPIKRIIVRSGFRSLKYFECLQVLLWIYITSNMIINIALKFSCRQMANCYMELDRNYFLCQRFNILVYPLLRFTQPRQRPNSFTWVFFSEVKAELQANITYINADLYPLLHP